VVDRGIDRPVLANGERLVKAIEPPTGGGGPKFHPREIEEARQILMPQVEALNSTVTQIEDRLRGPRIFFQATLLPNYLAASYFPGDLLGELDLVPVGSRRARGTLTTRKQEREETETKSLILAGTEQAITRLSHLVGEGPSNRSEIKAIENLREFDEIRLATFDEVVRGMSRLEETGQEPLSMFEAVLHPSTQTPGHVLRAAGDDVWTKWMDFISALGGEVVSDYRRELRGLTFVPVRLPPDRVQLVAEFNPLRAIRPMPTIRPLPTFLRAVPSSVSPPKGSPHPVSDLSVAVFDGGVHMPSSVLSSYVNEVDVTTAPAPPGFREHGTAVTASVLYGNPSPGTQLGPPSARVEHYRVVPLPPGMKDPEIYWVLDRIREHVENGQFRIVNLSIGPEMATDDDEPDRWTAELDTLAYEEGTLFLVAAGNNGLEDAATGLNRVQVPADMINGLSVGACDVPQPDNGWNRSPYSAVGPGRDGGRIQPVGVQFGGKSDTDSPFLTISKDGTLIPSAGTSFATPVVTSAIALLTGYLGVGRSTANTLKAFAVHFAEQHPDGDDSCYEVGYGRYPLDFESYLNCAPNEVTLLYEGSVPRNTVVTAPLPFPSGIDEGRVQITWTLVVTTEVQPTEPSEYPMSTLELTFRPHSQRFRFTAKGKKGVTADVQDRRLVAQLLADGYTPSHDPVAKTLSTHAYGYESERREAGKWETIKHARLRMNASSLLGPRLDLRQLSRDAGLLNRTSGPLDYSLLVSLKAGQGINLYDQVRATFRAIAPIPLTQRVRARTTS
jgi:hypothetical protein